MVKKNKKITKDSKIKTLEKTYKGALAEFIYRWHESLIDEDLNKVFWEVNKPETVEEQLKESGLI